MALTQSFSLEDLERDDVLARAEKTAELERQCRIHLASDWKKGEPDAARVIELRWNPGGPHGRDSLALLKPGATLVRPLWQAQAWFGPFALFFDFKKAETDKQRDFLKAKYRAEKHRVMMKYGYPMGNGRGQNPDMTPVGPHRFPDITVTVIDAEGNDLEPMRLHQVYGIGEFDKAYPLESFGHKETPAEVEARLTEELTRQQREFAEAMDRRDKQVAELAGMVKGLAVAIPGAAQPVAGA